jgi:hypothetical protein
LIRILRISINSNAWGWGIRGQLQRRKSEWKKEKKLTALKLTGEDQIRRQRRSDALYSHLSFCSFFHVFIEMCSEPTNCFGHHYKGRATCKVGHPSHEIQAGWKLILNQCGDRELIIGNVTEIRYTYIHTCKYISHRRHIIVSNNETKHVFGSLFGQAQHETNWACLGDMMWRNPT